MVHQHPVIKPRMRGLGAKINGKGIVKEESLSKPQAENKNKIDTYQGKYK
jgi:hypothetical protein